MAAKPRRAFCDPCPDDTANKGARKQRACDPRHKRSCLRGVISDVGLRLCFTARGRENDRRGPSFLPSSGGLLIETFRQIKKARDPCAVTVL